MELFSHQFKKSVTDLLSKEIAIIATVPEKRFGQSLAFVQNLCQRADVHLITITRSNRDQMVQQILNYIELSNVS